MKSSNLSTTIEQMLPDWSRAHWCDDRKVATCVKSSTFEISQEQVEVARQAILTLSDEMALASGMRDDANWRSMALPEMLCAWGWAAGATSRGSVHIQGIYSDVILPESFEVIAKIAPFLTSPYESRPAIVFAPGDHVSATDGNLFALKIRQGTAEVKPDHVDLEFEF